MTFRTSHRLATTLLTSLILLFVALPTTAARAVVCGTTTFYAPAIRATEAVFVVIETANAYGGKPVEIRQGNAAGPVLCQFNLSAAPAPVTGRCTAVGFTPNTAYTVVSVTDPNNIRKTCQLAFTTKALPVAFGGPCLPGVTGIDTGLGCIPTTPDGLVQWVLILAVGISGGIALLLLIYGGIKYIMSGGDPKAMQEAQQTITAALSGLAIVFFSVLILKVIGFDILGIPNWGWPGGGILVTP